MCNKKMEQIIKTKSWKWKFEIKVGSIRLDYKIEGIISFNGYRKVLYYENMTCLLNVIPDR